MALPGPGNPLSINQIRTELGSSSGSLRALSALAGFSTPDAISDFYGYSPPATCGPISVGNNSTNRNTACSNFNTGVVITVYASPQNLQTATILYRTSCGGVLRAAGYYSDGVKTRYWNGTAFTTTFDCIL
jgi:hypothetical protein